MENYPKIDSTVVVIDIRNFTCIFELFQKDNNKGFLQFIEEYYLIGLTLAKLASNEDNFYLSSSGDGLLAIFFGANHECCGYLYSLVMYELLEFLCTRFNQKNNSIASFGIGIESGYVQRVISQIEDKKIETYLGSVINTASRIESITKNLSRTKLIVGECLYKTLVKKLFSQEYDSIDIKDYSLMRDYEEIVEYHNEMNKLNQNLMLFHIFEYNLRGVETPLRLFRLSPTLANIHKGSFFNLLKKLASCDEKYLKITSFIKQYISDI